MARIWELDGAGGSAPPCTPSLGDNQLMLTTRVDTADISRSIPTDTTNEESFSWTTDTGDPGIADWEEGDYIGSVNASVVDGNASFTIQLLRRTSACGTGETLGTSTSFSSAGIASFTVNIDPSAGAAGDLYQMRVIGSNSHMHNTQTITVTIDDPDTFARGEFDPPVPISNETTLFISGKPSGEMDLFISGKPSGDMTLFIANIGLSSGDISLFIKGKASSDIPLFISGKPSGEMDLFIGGLDNTSDTIDLFLRGKNSTTNTNIFVGDIIEDKIFSFTPQETCITDVNHPLGVAVHDELQDKFWVTSEDPTSGAPTDLTIDKGNQKLFITENTGRIVKTDFDGSTQEIIVAGLSDPQSIDIDESISTIFWTDKHIGVIQKSDLSGGSIQVVLSGLAAPEGLALDRANQRIFWSNVSGVNIQSTNYDGSSTQDVIPSGLSNPRRLAFDNRNNKLYWTDFDLGVVQRSNPDGTSINTVAAGLSGPVGLDVLELNLPLFIQGHEVSSGDISLFIEGGAGGATPISEEISLYIGGIPSGDIPLFIEGKDNTAGNITLFTQGQPSGDAPLFISGKPSGDVSLFMSGKPSGELDLFIQGHETSSDNIPLFIAGIPSGTIDLFISGKPSGNMTLFIRGFIQSSGNLSLFILGCAPKAATVTPTDLFTISDDVINIFERGVDAIIDQLGKNIKLIFDPIIIPCVNCIFDPIGGKSTNRFKPGGPVPFSDGARCPYCRGAGKTEQERSEIIKASVSWGAEDYSGFGISVQNARAVISTKTLLSDVVKIQRSKTAIIDVGISNILKVKCRRLKDSVPAGLKNSRYAITFWQRI